MIVEVPGINLRVLITTYRYLGFKIKDQLLQQGFLDHLEKGKVLYTIVSEIEIT